MNGVDDNLDNRDNSNNTNNPNKQTQPNPNRLGTGECHRCAQKRVNRPRGVAPLPQCDGNRPCQNCTYAEEIGQLKNTAEVTCINAGRTGQQQRAVAANPAFRTPKRQRIGGVPSYDGPRSRYESPYGIRYRPEGDAERIPPSFREEEARIMQMRLQRERDELAYEQEREVQTRQDLERAYRINKRKLDELETLRKDDNEKTARYASAYGQGSRVEERGNESAMKEEQAGVKEEEVVKGEEQEIKEEMIKEEQKATKEEQVVIKQEPEDESDPKLG
ncbi:hypothetical protein B0A55_03035 [Friedmanniomyces simplex]|uniref:Uncharacterized protein n=1 Tax=Friedmanniomyces simplex TaxID=329884 RepID=A0A4U0XUH6_9PEZI|nr:hypothetical protein B0A55_03035 [Friedmanniomyces simplex]